MQGPYPPAWEGKALNWIEGAGFEKTNFREALDRAGIFGGTTITNEFRIASAKLLMASGCYDSVSVDAGTYGTFASLTIRVIER